MVRLAFIAIFTLLGISSLVIYMQWQSHIHENVKANFSSLVHDIVIEHNEQFLSVSHKVTGFREKSYSIVIPAKAKELTCLPEPECTIQSQNGTQVINIKDLNELELRYKVLLPKQTGERWLDDWSVVFQSKQKQEFDVKLLDFTQQTGEWIAGAKQKGKVRRENFTYYSWAQRDLLSVPLYYYPGKLIKTVQEETEIYSARTIDKNRLNMTTFQRIADVPSLTIVAAATGKQYISPTLLVLPERKSLEAIQREYIKTYYKSIFSPNSEMTEWAWDLLAALTLELKGSGQPSSKIVDHVSRQLDDGRKHLFLDDLQKYKGEKLTLAILDESLEQVMEGSTSFFVDNARSSLKNFTPLYVEENLTIFVHNEPLKNIQPILYDRKRLLPFVEIMRELSYQVKKSGQTVFIDKEYNSWRFFVNSNIYMEGSNRFGASTTIIHEVKGKLYISEEMLREWFHVSVRKTDEGIYIANK